MGDRREHRRHSGRRHDRRQLERIVSGQRLFGAVYDRQSDEVESYVRDYVEQAWPDLEALGLTDNATRLRRRCSSARRLSRLSLERSSCRRASRSDIELKRELYARVEPAFCRRKPLLHPARPVCCWARCSRRGGQSRRFILGHPFNPPHLIPLVEVLGNTRTAEGVLERAERVLCTLRQGHHPGQERSARRTSPTVCRPRCGGRPSTW